MAQRIQWIPIKMTIHPLFIPILLGLVLYGNVSHYAIIISSLLIHEIGHLIICYVLNVPIKRCIIMPYGGEIELQSYLIHPLKECCIALGGPIATVISLCIAKVYIENPLLADPFIKMQIILLTVNLIPIFPLDGGRILYSILIFLFNKGKMYEIYLLFSLLTILFLMFLSFVFLPHSLFLLTLTFFLLIQIMKEWRFRKYRIAFEKLVLKRLT